MIHDIFFINFINYKINFYFIIHNLYFLYDTVAVGTYDTVLVHSVTVKI